MGSESMISFLEKAYAEINDNIKFSEAKNGALVTLNSAAIAIGSNIVFSGETALVYRWLFAPFVITLILPLLFSLFSLRATTGSERGLVKRAYELLSREKCKFKSTCTPKLMFFGYVYANIKTAENYLKKIDENCNFTPNSMEYQLASQIVDLSEVAYRKFMLFNIAIKIEMFIFAGLFLVSPVVLVWRSFL